MAPRGFRTTIPPVGQVGGVLGGASPGPLDGWSVIFAFFTNGQELREEPDLLEVVVVAPMD